MSETRLVACPKCGGPTELRPWVRPISKEYIHCLRRNTPIGLCPGERRSGQDRRAPAGTTEPERDSVIVRVQGGARAFTEAVMGDPKAKAWDIRAREPVEMIGATAFDFPWASRYEVAAWLLSRPNAIRLETNQRIVLDAARLRSTDTVGEREGTTFGMDRDGADWRVYVQVPGRRYWLDRHYVDFAHCKREVDRIRARLSTPTTGETP